jgi:hypothetical protein
MLSWEDSAPAPAAAPSHRPLPPTELPAPRATADSQASADT